MNIKQSTLLMIVFALGVGAGIFLVSKGTPMRPASAEAGPLVTWLQLTPGQARTIQNSKTEFDREIADIHDRYDREKDHLSNLFSDTTISDRVLLEQMARVMAAHDALQRRTVRYALAVRSNLTPDQKERFMGLFADYSRGVTNVGRQPGRGQGRHRSWGQGGRHGYRWGQARAAYGLIPLSPEKIQALQKVDPEFTGQSAELISDLQREYQVLTQLFEQNSAGDDQILNQLEKTITAHDALEIRVGRHIVAVRSHLSPDQQRQLMAICAENVQKTCCRPKETRHGPGNGN